MTSIDDSLHSHGSKEISETSHDSFGKVRTTGDNDEFIILGNQKFHRHELMTAFGGTLNPGLAPPPAHEFANPAPMGLAAFALTTFVLSMVNARAMGVTTPNVVVGLSCFYGGAVQFLAGVWELLIGNLFGGTALTSYGAFWFAYSAIQIESFGIVEAYGDDTVQLQNAVGFFLLGWALFTAMLTVVTVKSTVAFFGLFFTLTLTFILLAAGDLTQIPNVTRAGGVMGVITAFFGFYNAFAGVANRQNSYFVPHVIPLTKA